MSNALFLCFTYYYFKQVICIPFKKTCKKKVNVQIFNNFDFNTLCDVFYALVYTKTFTHIYSLRNIQRTKRSAAIYHFHPIEVFESRRRRHKTATAAGGPGRGAWKPKLAGEDTKQQGCQNIRKRRSRAQKERRASSSKTLA